MTGCPRNRGRFSQLPRFEPLSISTQLTGIGTANQDVTGTAQRPVRLETERDIATLGIMRQLGRGFDVQVRFRNEEKDGSRFFGRQGPDFLAEPIDYTTRQWEVILGYTGEQLQLSGGYYGSFFTNRHSALFAANGGAAANNPISLPPDNESHQLYLSGGYSFSATTRGNFKLSYAKTTQDEPFFTAPTFPGNTRTHLGGDVRTTLAQIGLTAQPVPKLSLLADLQRSSDRAEYRLEASTGSLPDVRYELNAYKLYARWALRQNYGIRADFVHERWKTDEWAWINPTFYTGTTVSQEPRQRVNFLGLSFYYQWL